MDKRLIAANTAFEQGRTADAADLLVDALQGGVAPEPDILIALLHALFQLGRDEEGLAWACRAVEAQPGHGYLHNLLGIFQRHGGDYAGAIASFDQATALDPADGTALANKGHLLADLGEAAAAETVFAELVRIDPASAEHHRALARTLLSQGRHEPAMVHLEQAVVLQPDLVDAWLDLVGIAIDRADLAEAHAILDRALRAMPQEPVFLQAKARTWRRFGHFQSAEMWLDALLPAFAEAGWLHHEIAVTVQDSDRQRSILHHANAVELAPGNPVYRIALAGALESARGPAEGANLDAAYELLCGTDWPAQLGTGDAKTAFDIFTRAGDYGAAASLGSLEELGRAWATGGYHSSLLKLLPWARTAEDRHELVAQHRLWGDLAVETARRAPITIPAPRPTGGKIRLGFLSSDLREHPVAYFALPLFEQVDRERFEIFVYSFYRGETADPVQQRIAGLVDHFRWHPDIADRDAAQMIADDRLDMLLELGGATHMNKIEAMAWKPARRSASWLGYPHSIGLDTIDHLLVDPYLLPPDPALLIERPLAMPHSWIVMSPHAFPESHLIDPVVPVRRNGFVTFGTANNPYKYGPEMLAAWARVVAAVPGSRFLFVRPEGGSQAFVRNIRAHFAAQGVAPERVEFRAVSGTHMAQYNEIDIALDTFPQTGGTTTCEAAWMGVPTVTVAGAALFERLSHSILHNAGLGDLSTDSPEAFHAVAVALAADTDRLQALRSGLRDQLKAGPLGQTEAFARDFFDLITRAVAA
jgi:protein O-GlcNAc transferase